MSNPHGLVPELLVGVCVCVCIELTCLIRNSIASSDAECSYQCKNISMYKSDSFGAATHKQNVSTSLLCADKFEYKQRNGKIEREKRRWSLSVKCKLSIAASVIVESRWRWKSVFFCVWLCATMYYITFSYFEKICLENCPLNCDDAKAKKSTTPKATECEKQLKHRLGGVFDWFKICTALARM